MNRSRPFVELAGWLSRDPIGERGNINLYLYPRNDPCNQIDLQGMRGIPPGWGISPPTGLTKQQMEDFKCAVQRYFNACSAGDDPQDVDCHTICSMFFGNVSTPTIQTCMDYCADCNLHNFNPFKRSKK